MKKSKSTRVDVLHKRERLPFSAGALVVVTLSNPRDKFWGVILLLAPEGLSISGIELASFDDLVAMVKSGEPCTPAVVFFPMHRIERIELDMPDGSLPSLSQRFEAKTGQTALALLTRTGEPSDQNKNNPEVNERAFSRLHSERGFE